MGVQYNGVTVKNLIDARLVRVGEKLTFTYGIGGRNRKTYNGIVLEDGSIETRGEVFTSLSYAANHVMEEAGAPRRAINGWWAWKNSADERLEVTRTRYLKSETTSDINS